MPTENNDWAPFEEYVQSLAPNLLYPATSTTSTSQPGWQSAQYISTTKNESVEEDFSTMKDSAEEIAPLPGFKGFTFGCDPEFFLVEKKTGHFVPAHNFLKGSKEEPFKLDGGAMQIDGLAGEVNIDPVSSFTEFKDNLEKVMQQVADILPPDITISNAATAKFIPEIYNEVPDQFLALGCSPDYNAWTGLMNPPPSLANDPYLRCAGGHLHTGWTSDRETDDIQHILHCRDLVQQMDWMLGMWSTRIDKDTDRRKLYGKAGACRIKPYGVEYRVLSNFWLHDPVKLQAVWNRWQIGLYQMSNNFLPGAYPSKYNDYAINIINNPDVDPAVVRRMSKDFPSPFIHVNAFI